MKWIHIDPWDPDFGFLISMLPSFTILYEIHHRHYIYIQIYVLSYRHSNLVNNEMNSYWSMGSGFRILNSNATIDQNFIWDTPSRSYIQIYVYSYRYSNLVNNQMNSYWSMGSGFRILNINATIDHNFISDTPSTLYIQIHVFSYRYLNLVNN